jgi:DNA-directed RNA polymerase specialized sigma24 family protein
MRIVVRALGGLSVAQRELVILRLVEGREYTEIAAILDCRLATARTRVVRAVHVLKEHIESMMVERT